MSKRKKKKEQKKRLMTALITCGFLIAILLGYFLAKTLTELKIAKQASYYVYDLRETLDLLCNDIDMNDPNKKVRYSYDITCYYSSPKSEYNKSIITINNSGEIKNIKYIISINTSKSREETFADLDEIMSSTNDAIKASKVSIDKNLLSVSTNLSKEFKIKLNNTSYESNAYIKKMTNRYTIEEYNYYAQKDEQPFIPPYIVINLR